jgi:hypothetical protein
VKLRSSVEFVPGFPNDGVEREDGMDFVHFPGRSIAKAVGDLLVARGYEVSDPIEMGFIGWELDIRKGGRRFWLRVNYIDEREAYLATRDLTWQFWRRRPSFRDFLLELEAELQLDGRFGQMAWLRDNRDDTRTPHPVA